MSSLPTDQASALRSLIDQARIINSGPSILNDDLSQGSSGNLNQRLARSIAICSGKGGVGKSLFALNLAIALAKDGRKVCLLDANLGLGNLDLLCGLNGYWNLSHVLTGARQLNEIILDGPQGISILPGASGLIELTDLRSSGRDRLIQELARLEQQYDYFIIDNGAGISRNVQHFSGSADTVLLMTTMETTALADTYAALKVYRAADLQDVRVVFNRADTKSAKTAIENMKKTAKQFLQCDVNVMGCIPEDPQMQQSVSSRTPLLLRTPESSAGVAITQLARILNSQSPRITTREDYLFIKRLYAGQLSAA